MRKGWRLVLLLALAVAISLRCSGGEPRGRVVTASGPVTASAVATAPSTASGPANATALKICSFNIQFLGLSKVRDNLALANILADCDIADCDIADCDIVAVQELVAPPCDGVFPNGDAYRPDPEAAEFFKEMEALGFAFVLSPEDTGRSRKNHNNGPATEWWVAFYLPSRVKPEGDVASQFLADHRTGHPDYDRVPYAFALRTLDGKLDFVLISVHLHPGPGRKDKERRAHELASIVKWIHANDNVEKDFIILGDMNIENAAELASAIPTGFVSLNDECRPTNTNVKGPKPYDHVMYNPTVTTETDKEFDLQVINLIDVMKDRWTSSDPYPGHPSYVHNAFRAVYSDHHPVVFRMVIPAEDDDRPE